MKLGSYFILFFGLVLVMSATAGFNQPENSRIIIKERPFTSEPNSIVRANPDGRYHPLPFTAEDVYYMTEALYFEAATESPVCQEMVANVVFNRWYDSRWKGSIKDIIWAKYQFSYTHDGKPEHMRDLDTRKHLESIAIKVLGGNAIDNSQGSMYYYNPKLANPNWDWSKIEKVGSCDDHDFYKDKLTKEDF